MKGETALPIDFLRIGKRFTVPATPAAERRDRSVQAESGPHPKNGDEATGRIKELKPLTEPRPAP